MRRVRGGAGHGLDVGLGENGGLFPARRAFTPVDPARAARYLDKAKHARERLGLVAAWSSSAAKDVQARLASYKAFQEAAEALGDILGMALIDAGHTPKDDYTNLDAVVAAGILAPSLAPPLREVTGLRNRLVHEYEGIDTMRALEAMRRLAPSLHAAFGEVERWLRSQNA